MAAGAAGGIHWCVLPSGRRRLQNEFLGRRWRAERHRSGEVWITGCCFPRLVGLRYEATVPSCPFPRISTTQTIGGSEPRKPASRPSK
jgi:hypothetical protein